MTDFAVLERILLRYTGRRRSNPHREAGSAARHGIRLRRGVVELRRMVTQDGSHDEALMVAALFHDIRAGEEPHGEIGARTAAELLRGRVERAVLLEALSIIRLHDTREEKDMFLSLFRDADLLDGVGCCGIFSCFAYSFDTGRGREEALTDWYERKFDPAMDRLRRELHFDASRRVFDEKAAFERAFRTRLALEARGSYITQDGHE